MSVIEIKNLTRDYGEGKGIFDVTFQVNKGEVFGFLGPNGAGKTTTIRRRGSAPSTDSTAGATAPSFTGRWDISRVRSVFLTI